MKKKIGHRFREDDLLGIHYALNIFLGASVLWLILDRGARLNPIWAISAMVAACEPRVRHAVKIFRGRIINSILGCAVGLLFLIFGSGQWSLPLALSVAALAAAYMVRVPEHWRQAPITAALVVASSWTHHSKTDAIHIGLLRVGEVMLGCVVGIVTSWLMARAWPPPEERAASGS